MGDPGSANGRGDDRDRMDDDALADAIFAMYTSSIPVVPPGADAAEDDSDRPDEGQESEPDPAPDAEPAPERMCPPADPEPPTVPEPPTIPETQTAPAAAQDPASGPRVWDLDEDEAPPSRVWDLGDLPPSIPFDVPSVGVPHPAEPPPVAESAGWTRLAEPGPESAAPETSDPPAPSTPGNAWAPPVWEPESIAPPESSESAAADDSPFSVYSEAGVDPEVLERMQEDLSAGPEPTLPDAPPPDATTTRREPTPWFDLASAPPPDPSTSVRGSSPTVDESPAAPVFPPPSPPPLVEPPTSEPVQPELSAADATPEAPSPDPVDEPSVDALAPEAPMPTVVPFPDSGVRSSPLPPAMADAPPPRTDEGFADAAMPDAASSRELDPPDTGAVPPGSGPERLPRAGRVERTRLEPTAAEQRAGRSGRLFWMWVAPTGTVLAAGAGAVLFSAGMSLRQTIIAALLGVAVSFLPLGVVAFAARGSGQPTLVTSRATFGLIGNVLPALVAVVTRAVIGGILLWLAGSAAKDVLARYSVPSVSVVLAVGVVGVVAAVVAAIGYGLLSRALFVLAALVGVLSAGLITLTAHRLDLTAALGVPDGSWFLLIGGAVVIVSLVGLAWAQSGGDVARYQARTGSGSATVVSASAGAVIPALVLVVWGALLAASSPALARGLGTDPVGTVLALLPSWAALPFLALLVVSSAAGAAIAVYSGGFALLATGIRMPRPAAAVVTGVLVVAAGIGLTAAGFSTRTVVADVLPTLAVPVAAWVGIIGAETLIRRRRLHAPSLLARGGMYPAVRTVNTLAFVVVTAIGWAFSSSALAGLDWQGWAFPLVGISSTAPIAESHIGVLIALGLGLLVPVVTAIPTIRKQEAVRADAGATRDGRLGATT